MTNSPQFAEIYVHRRDDKVFYALVYDRFLWQIVIDVDHPEIFVSGAIVGAKVIKRLNPVHAIADIGSGKEAFLEASSSQAPEGSLVLCQIRRDAYLSKGPTLTMKLQYQNRYAIYEPSGDFVESSNQSLMQELSHLGWRGQIKPTAKSLDKKLLLEMLHRQISKHKEIKADFTKNPRIGIVSQPMSPSFRIWHEVKDIKKISVDDKAQFNKMHRLFTEEMPELCDRLQYYAAAEPIFNNYDIFDQWSGALTETMSLGNQSRLIFESTQALHVIDVDHAGALADPFVVNRNATFEIARQISLRNMGGLIVVDFLKMQQQSQRLAIQQFMENAFLYDSRNTHILGFTKSGLFEITRPRRGGQLLRYEDVIK